MGKYVLAYYDVRGKQAFIFRTNKIKEIIGGSCIIRDIFKDYLYPAADQYRDKSVGESDKKAIITYNEMNPEPFSTEQFKEHMKKEEYLGEVVYDGGGNFFVLYKSMEIFKGVNRIFTKSILENIGALNVLCSCVEVSDDDLTDYIGDRKHLYEKHHMLEASEITARPVNGIPFIQIDPMTSMPLTDIVLVEGQKEHPLVENKVSLESAAKYKKYHKLYPDGEKGETVFDALVKEKGKDSLLAVIFIDGNNMGAKVQGILSPCEECKTNCEKDCMEDCKGECQDKCWKTYDNCVTKLRNFSKDIQSTYVDKRLKAIEEMLVTKYGDNGKHRMVVFAGDEMSFVVRAEDALPAVETYFKDLDGEDNSSCAGIAIFHSHAPYAEAYKIAEECCEEGKRFMKRSNEKATCYLDFQFCRSGMGRELSQIRKAETGDLISKPWLIKDNGNANSSAVTLEQVKEVVAAFHEIDSRTNVKSLISPAEASLTDFNLEMDRIYAHQSKEIQEKDVVKAVFAKKTDGTGLKKDEARRRLIYDIATVYDLWFRKEKSQ